MTMASAASSSEIQKTLNDLKNQAQEIADQGAALQQEIDANQSDTQTTIEKKSDIDKQITITEAEIQNTNAQIQQYSLLIAEKQSELEDALARQAEMNETYKARIRAMEENGTISYWSVLFKATSFSDLLSRIDSIHEVAEADQRMLDELDAIAQEIEADRQSLEDEMAAQEEAKAALAEQEATLQAQRSEADAYLIELAAAYDNLTDEYLANEAQEEALRKEIMEARPPMRPPSPPRRPSGWPSRTRTTWPAPAPPPMSPPAPRASSLRCPARLCDLRLWLADFTPSGVTSGSTTAWIWRPLRARPSMPSPPVPSPPPPMAMPTATMSPSATATATAACTAI